MSRIAVLLLLAACSSSPTGPSRHWLRDLDAARERWQASGITDYSFTYRKSCFCPPLLVRVNVRDGQITAIFDQNADTAFVAPFDDYTMTGLFNDIEQVIDNGPHRFTADYDDNNGRVVSMSADPIANAVDDEWAFSVSEFSVGDQVP